MQILIAADSYKDCLSSVEVGKAISQGVAKVVPDARMVVMPVSDGGEGFLEAVRYAFGGEWITSRAHDPLMRPITTEFLYNQQTKEAFVETARTCGLSLLDAGERNPEKTSTYGLGEIIASAVKYGARHVYVGLGGSATNDGGMGMLSALGYVFTDASGHRLEGRGEELKYIDKIDGSSVPEILMKIRFTGLCDVKASFYGMQGATFVFGCQKGGTLEQLERLEDGMVHFSRLIRDFCGLDVANLSGSGAAGGLGGALKAFFRADLVSGINFLLSSRHFNEVLDGSQIVITGEGSLDDQSKMGKAVFGILQKASERGIPVVAVAGKVAEGFDSEKYGFTGAFPASPQSMPLQKALMPDTARRNIASATASALRLLLDEGKIKR